MSKLPRHVSVVTSCLMWMLILGGCTKPRLAAPLTETATGIANRTGLPAIPEAPAKGQVRFPPGINLDRPLSADDAAAIALWNNRQLHVDLAALGLAQGDWIEA